MFPNWRNGESNDLFHEKHPQYPVYSLPHRGNSTYKDTFIPDKIEQLNNQTQRVQSGRTRLPMTSYTATGFDFQTTNNLAYKDFKFNKAEQTVYQAPAYGAVVTRAPSSHFLTTNKRELKTHIYKKPEIDKIPYP